MVKKKKKILFLGLSHIGQVYSTSWINKIGACSVYDFNHINLEKFRDKKFTDEEPYLKKNKYSKKFIYLKDKDEIKNYEVIFFTYDTPLNKNNGKPNLSLIRKNLKKIYSIKFKKKVNLFIASQVYPGFTDNIISKYKNKMINTIYFVDTLKMGNATNSFLKPEQLIFGSNEDYREIIKEIFKKFKCKKYLFSIKEAELIKISINLYLFFSVSFANIIDDMSKKININFIQILNVLKNDRRIGKYSYIQPSLGMSGGHLERDYYYFQKLSTNPLSSKIFSLISNFNDDRKKILENKLTNLDSKKTILIGASYKKNSYSITNSNFKKIFKKNIKIYDDQFKLKDLKKKNIIKNLKDLCSFDFFIYNYSNKLTLKKIKEIIKKDKNKKLINLSIHNNSLFNKINTDNIFFKKGNKMIL